MCRGEQIARDLDGLVGRSRVQRAGVVGSDDRDRRDSQFSSRAKDAQRDLAAIRDEQLPDQAFLARVEEILGIERALHRCVQLEDARAELPFEPVALDEADTVLARDRSTERKRELEERCRQLRRECELPLVARSKQERRMQVAVAGVSPRAGRDS